LRSRVAGAWARAALLSWLLVFPSPGKRGRGSEEGGDDEVGDDLRDAPLRFLQISWALGTAYRNF
jgi:hypothetical protein